MLILDIPSKVDDFLKEFIVEARALIVIDIGLNQLGILLSLRGKMTETEIVNDAFKVASINVAISTGKILKGIN